MEYNVITDSELDNLIVAVNTAITESWEPIGGITFSIHESTNERKGYSEMHYHFAQAMVRK